MNSTAQKKRYDKLDPAQFRLGDIAEVEASLMLVPIKEQKHKLVAVLRSVTLLDTTFSQVKTIRDYAKKAQQYP